MNTTHSNARVFSICSSFFPEEAPVTFTEDAAPEWLRFGGRKGSTMDMRWFWNDHVLTLAKGQSVETDFQTITRLS